MWWCLSIDDDCGGSGCKECAWGVRVCNCDGVMG